MKRGITVDDFDDIVEGSPVDRRRRMGSPATLPGCSKRKN